jgi:F0F1-type ATP synthase epsilon subunit
MHKGGDIEKFFIPGGFAVTHENSVTDLSVPEAFPLSEFDDAAVKAGYAEAQKDMSSTDEEVKVSAQIKSATFQAMARAMGVSL